MNYLSGDASTVEPNLQEQAGLLAHITRELAQCCIAKEMEIFNRFALSASEGHALLAVSEGVSSPSALAEQLGVARSRITPLVHNLVTKGFVHETESREDRRMRDLRLTREGRSIANEALKYRLNFHTRLLNKFGEDEREQLIDTLTQLHDKMMEIRKGIR